MLWLPPKQYCLFLKLLLVLLCCLAGGGGGGEVPKLSKRAWTCLVTNLDLDSEKQPSLDMASDPFYII